MLVEMSIGGMFLNHVVLEDENGLQFSQPIKYERTHVKCDMCKGIGHSKDQCLNGRL